MGRAILAAAELVRRGYLVSFTMGNTPLADLMVARPDGSSSFLVDVKGQSQNGAWLIRSKPTHGNLFYILVRVGEGRAEDRFFILSHQQINDLIAVQKRIGEAKGLRDLGGFLWAAALPYEGKWNVLPGCPIDFSGNASSR